VQHDTNAAADKYSKGEIVGAFTATDDAAYQCFNDKCGKDLTEAGGWIRLKKKGVKKTDAQMKAAITECYDFSVDIPYSGEDLVQIEKAVYQCNPKRADECGQTDPKEVEDTPNSDGPVW
jgi:hypothetical protein